MEMKTHDGISVYTITGKVYIRYDVGLKKDFLEKLEGVLKDDEELIIIPGAEMTFIKKYPDATVAIRVDTLAELVLITLEDLIEHMREIAEILHEKNAGEKDHVEFVLA